MTIDVEDWFQVENLRSAYPVERWNSCDIRVESSTMELLDLLDRHNVRATFFVLGWIAERCGQLVRSICERGHEIASHGYCHQLCFGQSEDKIRDDLLRSKDLLEDLTGREVMGYRAPSFSITNEVVRLLGELGYAYDSSYNNFSANRRHGRPRSLSEKSEGMFSYENGVIELPISNLQAWRCTIPWGGGGYFRFWPSKLFHWGVNQILGADGRYVFYCHPWEIDAGQPRARELRWHHRFRHYLNLSETLKRLDNFLLRFNCQAKITCEDYLKNRINGSPARLLQVTKE